MTSRLELKCFVYDGWEPRIRPASPKRQWMDDAPELFPYRCLPLAIANSHGWEVLSNCGFEAEWNGGMAPEDVVVRPDAGSRPQDQPVALFGQGTFTIHVMGLFRTPPGWNLVVSGPPNSFKDGAAALSGVIETDWSPYSFTMNWRLTRPGHTVRFEENEPIAFIFPMQRAAIEDFHPGFERIDDAPELKAAYEAWSASRDAFQQRMRDDPPAKPADKWQKSYYRGLTPDGVCPVGDHKAKLKVREFASRELAGNAAARMALPVAAAPPRQAPAQSASSRTAQKYAWLLETQQQQRELSDAASAILRLDKPSGETFLDLFYAPGRPVIVTGAIAGWPALGLWTPEYLREKVGGAPVEYQGGRTGDPQFERYKDNHKQTAPFDQFIDAIESRTGNDAYVTAYNSAANAEAFRCLQPDIAPLSAYLDQPVHDPGGMHWIGPKGAFTSLHHDMTNNLLVQVTGSKRILLAAASDLPKLYNDVHVFSEIGDVTQPGLDLERYPMLQSVRFHELVLAPGEMLFIPIGWWHQVELLDFSVSMTFTNFRWRNDFCNSLPPA